MDRFSGPKIEENQDIFSIDFRYLQNDFGWSKIEANAISLYYNKGKKHQKHTLRINERT